MKENKSNLQTKRKLTESLKQLMRKKPINKISIREIAEGAEMNRQTFYYHFEDVYDIIRWMYLQETAVLLEKYEGMLFWQEGLLALFEYLEEEREIHLCVMKSVNRDTMRTFVQTESKTILGNVVASYGEEGYFDERYYNFLVHYYTIALSGMMESWLLGELDYTPQELVALFERHLQDQIRGAEARWRMLEEENIQ